MTGRHSFTKPTVAEWLAGIIQHPDDPRTPMRATFGGERENRRG